MHDYYFILYFKIFPIFQIIYVVYFQLCAILICLIILLGQSYLADIYCSTDSTCTSTDVPSIVSSDKVTYFDPQEKLWNGQSGRLYRLSEVLCTDSVNPFHGISDFNSETSSYYPKTLFRFPLRTVASGLSENVYSLEKVLELINALKAEAKLLLIFLRSVTSIEVYDIDNKSIQTLLFQTKVADSFLKDLTQRRRSLKEKIRASHEREKYNSSTVHGFVARFDVSIYNDRVTTTTRWLVSNQVGSSIPRVREASMKQKVFPWVGTALELKNPGKVGYFIFFQCLLKLLLIYLSILMGHLA